MDLISWVYIAAGTGLVALLLALFFATRVLAAPAGSDRMQELSGAIREGSLAFLRREYTWAAGFVAIMAVLIFTLLDWGRPWGTVAYIFGAALSALAGYVGLRVATAANVRITEAVRQGGVHEALPLALRGGAVAGFSVAGLGLAGLALAYLLFHVWLEVNDAFQIISAIGLGVSSVALFACVGGGIFAKAADVGADLAGRREGGLSEDDRRNPAVIADNVGDNVGGVAGAGADLLESYLGSLVASVAYAAVVFGTTGLGARAIVFPLVVAAVGTAAAVIGSLLVRPRRAVIAAALYRGTYAAAVIAVLGVLGPCYWIFSDVEGVDHTLGLFFAVVAGIVIGLLIGRISAIFTSDRYRPVKEIARQSGTGPTLVVLAGLSDGMRSAAFSVLVVAGGIAGSYWAGDWAIPGDGGLYGVTVAAIGATSIFAVVASTGAFAPIADSAGGIAQMSHQPAEVIEATDSLAALGSTTAAAARGVAAGSAAVTTLALLLAWRGATNAASLAAGKGAVLDAIDILEPATFIGLLLGGVLPFLVAALSTKAVSRAAGQVIDEVRSQFGRIPGLREGRVEARPEYTRGVQIATGAALRGMLLPAVLAVAFPLAIGFVDVRALGGFLAGALVSGLLLGMSLVNSGGAWSNAKKLVEVGAYGGKGSDSHEAAVIGDTIGDPFKDSSGPALSVLIKVMAMVSLVFAGAFVG